MQCLCTRDSKQCCQFIDRSVRFRLLRETEFARASLDPTRYAARWLEICCSRRCARSSPVCLRHPEACCSSLPALFRLCCLPVRAPSHLPWFGNSSRTRPPDGGSGTSGISSRQIARRDCAGRLDASRRQHSQMQLPACTHLGPREERVAQVCRRATPKMNTKIARLAVQISSLAMRSKECVWRCRSAAAVVCCRTRIVVTARARSLSEVGQLVEAPTGSSQQPSAPQLRRRTERRPNQSRADTLDKHMRYSL
jgi:hypothetical protein